MFICKMKNPTNEDEGKMIVSVFGLGYVGTVTAAYLERELPRIASIISPSISESVSDCEVIVITNGSKQFPTVTAYSARSYPDRSGRDS